jgi:ferredoxin
MDRILRVWVEHTTCVGNAMCETIATRSFRLNDNRQSEAIERLGDSTEGILEGAENCPVSAIFVEDAETGRGYFSDVTTPPAQGRESATRPAAAWPPP